MGSSPPSATPTPAATPRALRPFAENAFRLLGLEVGATAGEAAKAASHLEKQITSGKDDPRAMLALGPHLRTSALIVAAGRELGEPGRAAVHALFHPWIAELPADAASLDAAMQELTDELRARVSPFETVRPLASRLLPAAALSGESEKPIEVGGYLFPGDVDLVEAVGPPVRPERGAAAVDEAGFLAALERAPSALSDALLAAARLGVGRKLHAAYLRSLLAAADAGEPAAWRRLPTAASLFQEVRHEPSAPLILAWRDFVEGRIDDASRNLEVAASNTALTSAERARARVLRLRLRAATQPEETLADAQGLEGPEGAALRGALLLHAGDDEAAEPEIEAAWATPELRPRLAPLRALVQIERNQLSVADESLAFARPGKNAALAYARLAHARGRAPEAVMSYRDAVDEEDDAASLGAWWGLAILSDDVEERSVARSWLEEAADQTELAAPLARGALLDGNLEDAEAWLVRLTDDADGKEVRALILDRLGRRPEAWTLRGVKEEEVRDRARSALEAGYARAALDELAGVAMADPLRRRAARAVVLQVLAKNPKAEPDEVVRRELGRLGPDELALLDLPASLFRAVREVEAGNRDAAIVALRKHLDGGDDPLAARLFAVLIAAESDAWARVTAFLLAATQQPDLTSILDRGRARDEAAWDAAVVAAAAGAHPVRTEVAPGASPPVRWAVELLHVGSAVAIHDWREGERALRQLEAASPSAPGITHRARRSLLQTHFGEVRRVDPDAVRWLLELDPAPSREVLHDRAVYRQLLAAQGGAPSAEALVELLQAWDAALEAAPRGHPAHPGDSAALESELVAELVTLLGTVPPARAAEVRLAVEASSSRLGLAALARGGWTREGEGE